jgi:hypothetical protein
MRYATILRNPSTDDGTFGTILLDDHSSWSTGELPWKNNQNGISCIPAGTYICKWINSPKHGPCYQITAVPGRDMIEIHSANFMGDVSLGKTCQLLGCVALGKNTGKLAPISGGPAQTAVLQSKIAIAEFEANLKAEDFTLTIMAVPTQL